MTVTEIHRIICRARMSGNCLNGRATSVQFCEDLPMSEDGTYDSRTNTIVCDSCYMMIIPLTPSGRGLMHELQPAISAWQADKAAFERPGGC